MYDLQSLKLTEAESKVKRLERLEHSQGSELKQLKNAKNELEEKLQKEKHEHQQKTLTLKLETEQRDAREADLREVGGKLNTVTKEKNDCEEQLNAKDEELGKLREELHAMEESSKTFEQTAVECQLTDAKNLQIMAELRSDIKKYMELSKNSEAAMDTEKTKLEAELVQLKEKNDENEGKYHSTYEELIELKEALYKLGIEGLKRDQNWVQKLSEDERSVILQGVLNTDLIQNDLLGAEPTPAAPKTAEPAEVNEPPVEGAAQPIIEEKKDSEELKIEKSEEAAIQEPAKDDLAKNAHAEESPEKIENIILAPKVSDAEVKEDVAQSQIDEKSEVKPDSKDEV